MTEIEWQDPPPMQPRRAEHWDGVIRLLRKNPGNWAIITREWKSASAPNALRQAGIETTARQNQGTKTWTVYGRAPVVTPRGLGTDPDRMAGTARTPARPAGQAVRGKPSPALDPKIVEHQGGYLADRRARGVPATGK